MLVSSLLGRGGLNSKETSSPEAPFWHVGLRVYGAATMGFVVFRVQDLGFRVQGLGSGFRYEGLGFRDRGGRFWVLGMGYGVWGLGFWV